MSTAVVTGAAGAIGSATTRRLLEREYDVLAVDVDAQRLSMLPAPARTLTADLTDPSAADRVAAAAQRCDLLVNIAGIVVTTPFERASTEEILREQQVNLTAPMLLTRALLPALMAARGQIVAVASVGSMLPLAQSPGYSASKFGLRGFLLALGLRERETGVRVSIINPGSVDTPMLRHEAATGGSPLNFLGTPLRPDTIADAVLRQLDRPRPETNLPRTDGWLTKTVMLNPGLLHRLRPLLERIAQPNLRRYRQKNAIG